VFRHPPKTLSLARAAGSLHPSPRRHITVSACSRSHNRPLRVTEATQQRAREGDPLPALAPRLLHPLLRFCFRLHTQPTSPFSKNFGQLAAGQLSCVARRGGKRASRVRPPMLLSNTGREKSTRHIANRQPRPRKGAHMRQH
jgi:hypothetical protein